MRRPKYLGWMHGAGVILSVAASIVGGLHNPAIGFSIAIAILILFDVPSPSGLPGYSNKGLLRVIYGSISRGGVKRGIFIKEMFTLATLYLSISSFAFGMKAAGFLNALLGIALVISSIANEIEGSAIKKAMK